MNVGLTAINLLWNAADLLAKRSVHSAPSPEDSQASPALLDRQLFEELLRFLFRAIQVSPSLRPNLRTLG